MKNILITYIVLFSSICLVYSQQFEGSFDMVKISLSDTTRYTYTIKQHMLRVDEYNSYNELKQYFIVNAQDSSLLIISPYQKQYIQLHINSAQLSDNNAFELINTGVYKYINGVKCVQWRVRNNRNNTETSYWLATDSLETFKSVAENFYHIEKLFNSYNFLISEIAYFGFPMLIECKTLLRVNKIKYMSSNIKSFEVSQSTFSIPEYYEMYDSQR